MEENKRKTGFFEFDRETYNPETGKFEIKNINEQKTKLDNYIESEIKKIDDEQNIDLKANLAVIFNKNSKKLEKELTTIKGRIKKDHLNDLLTALDEFKTNLKEQTEDMKNTVGQEMIKNGLANVFYAPPSYEVKIGPTSDAEQVEKLIAFACSLGLDVKVYADGKLLKKEQEATNSQEETNFSESDDGMNRA